MDLKELNSEVFGESKVALNLNFLLKELKKRNLKEESIIFLNKKIEALNSLPPEAAKKEMKLKSSKNDILKHLEKEYKLVTKNYYAQLWLPLGMTVFGLPLGTVVFAATGNAAFIPLGLPIGMAIGSFYGAQLDKKAASEDRVIELPE
jgi:hypothetical protein